MNHMLIIWKHVEICVISILCDGPHHLTEPDPKAKPEDAVLTLFFFLIISNNPNTITFPNTFQILNENIYT